MIKDNKYSELYINDEEKMNLVKSTITKWCINDGFYDDFEVVKKIGAGAFANVNFFVELITYNLLFFLFKY